jgi:hypothetical protein
VNIMRLQRCITCLSCLLVLTCVAAPVHALQDGGWQPITLPADLDDVVIPDDLLPLIEQLDAPDFATRRQATQTLIATERFNRHQMYAALDRMDLSPEQRHRLVTVIYHRLVERPRGALGIRMEWVRSDIDDGGEIRIIQLIPGLPAIDYLQLDDRITHVDGQRLQQRDDLLVLVQNKKPGDAVDIIVRRPQREETGTLRRDAQGRIVFDVLPMQFPLGSADLLNDDPRPAAPSPVVSQRRMEANEAMLRFEPPVHRIVVTGEQFLTPISDSEVDNHPAIQALLKQLDAIRRGELSASGDIRSQWGDILQILAEQANLPHDNHRDKVYAQKVYERYLQLLPR